jgi:hypothetical protein
MIREFRYAVPPEYAPWMANAACADMDTDVFFPEFPANVGSYAEARAACLSCPVLEQCRAWGDRVEAGIPSTHWYGMLAGETPNERRRRRPKAHLRKQNQWCPYGHPYDKANTQYSPLPSGTMRRRCRACNRMRASRGWARLTGKGSARSLESPRRSA